MHAFRTNFNAQVISRISIRKAISRPPPLLSSLVQNQCRQRLSSLSTASEGGDGAKAMQELVEQQGHKEREIPPPPSPPPNRSLLWPILGGLTGAVAAFYTDDDILGVKSNIIEEYNDSVSVTNWSATHAAEPKRYYEPTTMKRLVKIVAEAHKSGLKIRPVGTALSPNGISMQEEGMLSLSHLDRILKIDKKNQTVTVEAGARVSQVLEALAKEGLTLQNFSSIQEQQMGGWTQVAAHGTGARLATVEEQIIRMKLVTPVGGPMELSEKDDPHLFRLVKVGLGTLGVVSELTLKCIPQHKLHETLYTTNLKELKKNHHSLLRSYRHVRYMWLPYVPDKIVVVVSNPLDSQNSPPFPLHSTATTATGNDQGDKLRPLRQALLQHPQNKLSSEDVAALGFTELRDALLDLNPLQAKHVAKVNHLEADYWSASQGERTAESTEILGFDCGGQQWVLEVAFPIGKMRDIQEGRGGTPDLDFVEKIMKKIKKLGIPAHCPIEQRWTGASTSFMSPAYNEDEEQVYSWVGIIMYLPPGQSPEGRAAITKAFQKYVKALEPLFEEYGAFPHWAKIEIPDEPKRLERLKQRLRERYPIRQFNRVRETFDPKGILSNRLIDTLFEEEEGRQQTKKKGT